jgi:hypothetical protein
VPGIGAAPVLTPEADPFADTAAAPAAIPPRLADVMAELRRLGSEQKDVSPGD